MNCKKILAITLGGAAVGNQIYKAGKRKFSKKSVQV